MSITMGRRTQIGIRMDPEAQEMAKAQAEKLGISTARYIELIVKFVSHPELMDVWMEMLVSFKKARVEMLKKAKK